MPLKIKELITLYYRAGSICRNTSRGLEVEALPIPNKEGWLWSYGQ